MNMRQGPNGRRGPRRPHPGGGGGGSNGNGGNGNGQHSATRGEQPRRSAASLRNQSFDSNGPDVRVRGNAWQVFEKYQSLARDAQMAGDRVAAENFLQHAEHYHRIIEAINEATAAEQAARGFGAQPEVRPAFPAPVTTEGAQVELRGAAQVFATPDNGAPSHAAASSAPQAQTEANSPTNPFFTPEESEAETQQQPARVAGF